MKPVRRIAGTLTKIDAEGRRGMSCRHRPAPARSPTEPSDPHNAQSLFYRTTFANQVGRAPT